VEQTLRILLCDDDDLICESLEEKLTQGQTAFSLPLEVRACLTAEQALAWLSDFQPHLVLMDLYLHHQALSGIEILEILQADFPEIRKIALTAFGNDLSEHELYRLQACEIDGFVAKGTGYRRGSKYTHCLDLCYEIWQGKPYYESFYLDRLVTLPERPDSLPPRQQAVLTLWVQGHTVPTIAQQLQISETSVKTHLQRIYTRLGLRKSPELFAYVQQQGWL